MSTRRRPPEQLDPVADREEVLALLSWAARDGSVIAMKTLLDELRRDAVPDEEVRSVIDELARRRGQ
jgi:hypothetical protein